MTDIDPFTMIDPFTGKEVTISAKLTDRLRGRYAIGPTMSNGEPEFGWRQFETSPIMHEAADRIEELEEILGRSNLAESADD